MKRVALIIPDAGPLISLGKAKSLDILLGLYLIRAPSKPYKMRGFFSFPRRRVGTRMRVRNISD